MDGSAAIAQTALDDGVYFGLPDHVYHSQPRLSASGIKNLLVSPLDFWARSWLNPKPKDDDDEPEWATKGKAYHKRICEGREEFYRKYVAELDPSEFKDALFKQAHLKAACKEMGLKVGGSNDELIERLIEAGYAGQIWDGLVNEHADENRNKTMLPAEWIYDIELAAACIEKSPTISKCFSGGFPEVSVFYTADVEKTDGSGEVVQVKMKARYDFLKPAAIVDLKTIANKMMKPLHRAVYFEMAAHKFHIQCAVYFEAEAALKHLITARRVHTVSGAAPTQAWLDSVVKHDKQFVWVMQQKGVAPVASSYVMPENLGLVSVGRSQVREAQLLYHEYSTIYGDLPWIMDIPMQQVGDNDIPMFASE